LACRECMYESIVQQKQAIKQEQRTLEQKSQELNNQKQLEELEAKRVILDSFDKTQNSMLGDRQAKVTIKDDVTAPSPTTNDKKRKFELSEEEIRSMSEKDIEKAALQLKKEKEEALKPKIGSFWVVSIYKPMMKRKA
jgi:nitric oxide synthase-interacting protein